MTWSFCRDAEVFLAKRSQALIAAESANCLAWGAIERERLSGQSAVRFATYDVAGEASAHALVAEKDGHIILSVMSVAHVHALGVFLTAQGVTQTLVEGPCALSQAYAEVWSDSAGRRYQRAMDQALYELTSPEMPELLDGRLTLATEAHREPLLVLMTGFASSFEERVATPEMLDARAARFIAESSAYLWQNAEGAFVSMAARVRQSPNTSSISWVYTPPEYRRQGYAARVVATLSEAELRRGKRACNLHTDLKNATSNAIYQRIGYRQIARSFRIRLLAS